MKKVCYLIIMHLLLSIPLNAAGGGYLIWDKERRTVSGYCLHFQHSTRQNQDRVKEKCCEKEKIVAEEWLHRSVPDKFLKDLDLDAHGKTNRNKGYWAIVVIGPVAKTYYIGIGIGDDQYEAVQARIKAHPGVPYKIVSMNAFDVSAEGAEMHFRHAFYFGTMVDWP